MNASASPFVAGQGFVRSGVTASNGPYRCTRDCSLCNSLTCVNVRGWLSALGTGRGAGTACRRHALAGSGESRSCGHFDFPTGRRCLRCRLAAGWSRVAGGAPEAGTLPGRVGVFPRRAGGRGVHRG